MARRGGAGSQGPRDPSPKGAPGGSTGSSFRRPSAKVLRRRRAVFFSLLALVLLAIVLAAAWMIPKLTAPAGPAAGPSASPATSGPASPQSAGPPTSAGTAKGDPSAASSSGPSSPGCDESLVTVTAFTDAPTYGKGQEPVLSLKVSNGGNAPCQVNVGTSQQEFTVMSGTDRIFDSKDCQLNPDDRAITLAPGQSESANLPWKRNRTAPGCPTSAGTAPGPGTYTLTVTLGTRASAKAVFTLQ